MKFPEQYRVKKPMLGYESASGDNFGVFAIPRAHACGRDIGIIACDGQENGWDHVSVSLPGFINLTPSWEEMCLVKSLFWDEDECVLQFHPPKSQYVNNHPGVLHLWKCVNEKIPMPPIECV